MQLTIEIDGQHNECLAFRPLQRRIRGRFDYLRDSEPQSKLAAGQLPQAVPGQRIGIADGVGFVEEPLHDDEHQAVRELLEARGAKLAPSREEFEDVDSPTWAYWLCRAVDAGVARIVDGKRPAKLDEAKVRKDFLLAEPGPSSADRLADVLDKLLTKLS